MIRSMTGYGSAEAFLAGRKFIVEMKSVNHRYLEISLRLPGMLSPLEPEIKKKIGELFSRGRIEAENYGHDGPNQSYFVKDASHLSKYYRTSEPVPVEPISGVDLWSSQQGIRLSERDASGESYD